MFNTYTLEYPFGSLITCLYIAMLASADSGAVLSLMVCFGPIFFRDTTGIQVHNVRWWYLPKIMTLASYTSL